MRSAGEERSTGEGTKRCLTVVALRGRIMVLIKACPSCRLRLAGLQASRRCDKAATGPEARVQQQVFNSTFNMRPNGISK